MIDPILDLDANLRERLTGALRNGFLSPPYSPLKVRMAIQESRANMQLTESLCHLESMGVVGKAAAEWIESVGKASMKTRRPDLVWTGPEVPGLHSRDTRRVFEDLLGKATQSIWASTFAYWDGQKAFEVLAKRMDECPHLQAHLMLNVPRPRKGSWGSDLPTEDLVERFRKRFWDKDWPGNRRPRVFYFPKALEMEPSKREVLHAKAIVSDEREVFITSANFTEAALDRNIELGFLLPDPILARQVIRQFQRLIEEGLLAPLQ